MHHIILIVCIRMCHMERELHHFNINVVQVEDEQDDMSNQVLDELEKKLDDKDS